MLMTEDNSMINWSYQRIRQIEKPKSFVLKNTLFHSESFLRPQEASKWKGTVGEDGPEEIWTRCLRNIDVDAEMVRTATEWLRKPCRHRARGNQLGQWWTLKSGCYSILHGLCGRITIPWSVMEYVLSQVDNGLNEDNADFQLCVRCSLDAWNTSAGREHFVQPLIIATESKRSFSKRSAAGSVRRGDVQEIFTVCWFSIY